MPGLGGIELVREIRAVDASLPVLILTAYASVEKAVEGIRAGATDFLTKPVNVDAVVALIERAVVERPVREAVRAILDHRSGGTASRHIVGSHPRLEEVRRFAARVATAETARVLITGESGTGKSLLARVIHDLSKATGRFVEVNCAALPAHLLESELFGHEKGAFTDARQMKRGLIEMAHRGTLLLDEIGALSPELQAKLLLFLERQSFRRLGSTTDVQVETRVIAATNDNLRERVRQRDFRLDLLYRLDVTSVEMPALRTMPSVIPELAGHFVKDICASFKRAPPTYDEESFVGFEQHTWPGNGRELRNVLERSVIFHEGGPLRVNTPPADMIAHGSGFSAPLGIALDELERRYIDAMLQVHRTDDLAEVARILGIARKTLWEKRRKYGL
jgi:DNA-binding NtrC family response regulator